MGAVVPGAAVGSVDDFQAAARGNAVSRTHGACAVSAGQRDTRVMSTSNPDLRYLEHTPAGAQYVSQITAQEPDRSARAAFRHLVLDLAPSGAALFDFGAGPGMDARFFAERGFTIEAYDVDPRMREFFAEHCRDLMDSGRVRLDGRAYRDFLTRGPAESGRRADLVISNFAPLNLVDDLRGLFAAFHGLTGPAGKVLASVLNPCPIMEMRS